MSPNSCLIESRPKFSKTLPPQTEATAHLNLSKLSIEKKRLQHELDTIEQRRRKIQKRLAFLDSQVAEMQKTTQAKPHLVPVEKEAAPDATALNTLFLEY